MTSPQVLDVAADFPPRLEFLFQPAPYKIAYGGRGATKSWGFARALLILGTQKRHRILCARETQKSIRDSVHELLKTQIHELGLESFYRVEKQAIYGANGSILLFSGLRHNIDNIKSMEAISICWVEEAQRVSKESWDKLIPTLFRIPDCELWISFNPDLESDNTYQRFVVDPPPGSVVRKLTWRDNPWFPEGLRREMETARARNLDEYNHIWEGSCINTLANAIYANELRLVDTENRIRKVPYDPTKPVDTAWDLGYGDMVSIWMFQSFPMEYRIIDYEEGTREALHHYLSELQKRPYVWGTDYLPWDGGLKALGSGKSIEELMRAAGRRIKVAPRLPVLDGINAVRTIFPLCYFDESKCAAGIRSLRCYRYGEMQSFEGPTREPLHDVHCLVPETLVLTKFGKRRIMDLQGEEVLTPCGWSTYQGPWITQKNAPLVEVQFADGSTVRCTPEHLFRTESGWKSAESLTPNTSIPLCSIPSSSTSMECSISDGLARFITAPMGERFIERCGRALLDQFQKAATSTIAITTLPITALQIWNAYPSPNIHRNGFIGMRPFLLRRERVPQHGTALKQAGSGIDSRPENANHGESVDANPRNANSAALNLWRSFVTSIRRGFAPRSAGHPADMGLTTHTTTMSPRIGRVRIALVSTAAKFLARLSGKPVSLKDSAPQHAETLLTIESVRTLTERSDVCCIEVPDIHCFTLANGVVVHNSHPADAFRTLAVSIRQPQKEREQELRRQKPYVSPWS